MNIKKAFVFTFTAIMALFVIAACTGPKEEAETADVDRGVTGIYTHTLTGEEMRDRLVSTWSQVTNLDTMVQNDTLVLTAKNTTLTEDQYELSKDLYNGEMGIHIEARFYGNYTYEGDVVHLETPKFYTWIYYRNGAIIGDSYVYQPVILEAANPDGASFFGDYLDYHGYHRVDPMDMTVNLTDNTFIYNIVTNDDTAELGVEAEDDGFNAGPIFAPAEDVEESLPEDSTNTAAAEISANINCLQAIIFTINQTTTIG